MRKQHGIVDQHQELIELKVQTEKVVPIDFQVLERRGAGADLAVCALTRPRVGRRDGPFCNRSHRLQPDDLQRVSNGLDPHLQLQRTLFLQSLLHILGQTLSQFLRKGIVHLSGES